MAWLAVFARDVAGQAHVLVDLHQRAVAHDAHLGMVGVDPVDHLGLGGLGDQQRVVALLADIGLDIEGGAQVTRQLAPGIGLVGVEQGQLAAALGHRAVIDGDAGAVRPALGHADQHGFQMAAERGLQGRVLQEQTDDAAHGFDLSFPSG
jgi:hypothetical protein